MMGIPNGRRRSPPPDGFAGTAGVPEHCVHYELVSAGCILHFTSGPLNKEYVGLHSIPRPSNNERMRWITRRYAYPHGRINKVKI